MGVLTGKIPPTSGGEGEGEGERVERKGRERLHMTVFIDNIIDVYVMTFARCRFRNAVCGVIYDVAVVEIRLKFLKSIVLHELNFCPSISALILTNILL